MEWLVWVGRDDTGIVLVKPDKGYSIVILDKADYCFKMDAILQDKSKFKRFTSDPLKTTTNRENKIRGFLRSLKNKSIISGDLYEKLIPTGSRPGIL